MGTSRNPNSQLSLLKVAVILTIITVVIVLPILSYSFFTTSPTPTKTVIIPETPHDEPTSTTAFALSATTDSPSPTPTPSPFPPPIEGTMGTNLPDNLRIDPWHDNSKICDTNPKHDTVTIYGVEITGGVAPYEITLWQFDNEFNPATVVFFKRYILFVNPVEVSKGEYVHVVITFESEGIPSTWIDDLYYPYYLNDPQCSG